MNEDRALLARAANFPGFLSLPELTRQTVHQISTTHGVDFATALLYDRIQRSASHRTFISEIETASSNQFSAPQSVTVAVVPAAFYKENPSSGADGKVIFEAASTLGLKCEMIPVASTGTVSENAIHLCHWLMNHANERVILVSLCKGGGDVKFALSANEGAFRNVSTWINVCGTLNGSPVAEWLLQSKPRFFIAWLFCKCRGHNAQFLRDLAANGPLSMPLCLPHLIRLINVVGFPLRRHLSNRFMRQCYQRVSDAGPNDGGILLADVCQLPGMVFPIWGADHYLRPEGRSRQIMSALLRHVTEVDTLAARSTQSGIPASDQTVQTLLA